MCPGFGCFPYVDMEIEDPPKKRTMNGPPQGWTARGGYYGANYPGAYNPMAYPANQYQTQMLWYPSPRDFAERGLRPPHPPGHFSPHNSNPCPWLCHPHIRQPAYLTFYQGHFHNPYQPPSQQAHFHNPYQPPRYPVACVNGAPQPHGERRGSGAREETFHYIPAGAHPTAAMSGRLPWYGRSSGQISADDARVAAQSGMYNEHDIEPKGAKGDQEFWCWEPVEREWARHSFDTIKNALQPGKWKRHPVVGCLYFHREIS